MESMKHDRLKEDCHLIVTNDVLIQRNDQGQPYSPQRNSLGIRRLKLLAWVIAILQWQKCQALQASVKHGYLLLALAATRGLDVVQ